MLHLLAIITLIEFLNFQIRPKFGCVVVKKRINARFFMEQRGNFANPPPGTIIDSNVTKRNWYIFSCTHQYECHNILVHVGTISSWSVNL